VRIAFDHQAFCRQAYGGVSRYYAHLSEALAASHENQVGVFAPFHINRHLQNVPSSIVFGRYLSKYPLLTKPLFKSLNRRLACREIGAWKPDVVHETYFSESYRANSRIPTVVTVYDMIHELYPDDFWLWDSTSRNKRIGIARADHVICISESTRNDLIRLFDIPPSKTSVVHLAYERFDIPSEADLARVPVTPFILFVGHRHGYKNFRAMIEAYAASMRMRASFDVICFGGGGFNPQELKWFKALDIGERVRQVSGRDALLGALYGSASALVYPSLYEGFGLPLLEAMAHDCLVVCSNTSSIPEVVAGAGEYFDPFDTESIRTAIEKVLFAGDDYRQYMIEKAQERLNHFSWKKCAEQTLEVYRNVA
jgi:glycosyltransferase involved in cell wall biosynthesis